MRASSFRRYIPIILILLIATYLRTVYIGARAFTTDEATHMLKAFAVARDHQLVLIGTPMSTGLWHSPLPIWVYAIPAVFSADPRLARVFTVVINLIGICILYRIAQRYFSYRTAVLAAFLCAIHPMAISGSTFIWNPNIGTPLVLGYVLTGLLGYTEDRRWARIMHLPLLFLAGQMHPTNMLIGPVTPVLIAYAWWHYPARRRAMLIETVVSGIAGVLMLVPWLIGLRNYIAETGGTVEGQVNMMPNRGWGYLLDWVYMHLGGTYDQPIQPILPVVTGIGAVVMLANLRRRSGFPGLVIILTYILMPILALVVDIPYREYHHRACYPVAFIMMGVALDTLIGWIKLPQSARLPRAASAVLQWAILVPLLAVLTYQYLANQWIFDAVLNEAGTPLKVQVDATRDAVHMSQRLNKPLILLIPTPNGAEPIWEWEVMRRYAADHGVVPLTVWGLQGIPLPEEGAVLFGPTGYTADPLLFAGGIEERWMGIRITVMPARSEFQADLPLLAPVALSNGATITGILRDDPGSLPSPGEAWAIHLIWRVDAIPADVYTAFVHLVDADGNKYGQQDVAVRPVSEWRVGDVIINRLVLDISETLPSSGPLYLRVGMYSPTQSADVLDAAGRPAGQGSALMQIRRSGPPLAVLGSSLEIDALATNSPLQQGQPLMVQAAWVSVASGGAAEAAPELHWRLTDADARTVFEQETALASVGEVPADVFIPGAYLLRLPTDLAAGVYDLTVSAEEGETYYQQIEIVALRERQFEPPAIQHPLEAEFADNIRLLGYDLSIEGVTLNLTLHWQPSEQVVESYHYFVHLIKDGQVAAQADGLPLANQYPTDWWAAGEVISDAIPLDLSGLGAGEYRLQIGLYDASTGLRVEILRADGVEDNSLLLEVLEVPSLR